MAKEFLGEKDEKNPVAGRLEFMGRKRQMQTILRGFRTWEKQGGCCPAFSGNLSGHFFSIAAERINDECQICGRCQDLMPLMARRRRA